MRSILFISVFLCALCCASFSQKLPSDVITIPVVVHVVYNNSRQNISDEQVRSQIAVLNGDYRKKNADAVRVPDAFKALAGDARIEFRLAATDPSGLPTSGIIRRSTSEPSFTTDDKVKFSASGGDDGWNRDEYLNLWVCNLTGGVLGYASAPGCAAAKDGVVIRYNAFGNTGTAQAPFNKGRTATHEIGHWLGLRHIWGDAPCGDDRIGDTPPQAGPTRGCPSGVIVSCNAGSAGNMYMNFMDFTDDACVNMFTNGQVARMRELFSVGASRYALLSSSKAAVADESAVTAGELSLYPNPAVNEIRISFAGGHDAARQLVIYNHVGQVMKQLYISRAETVVNISAWKAGIYFVSCNGKTQKFLKMD